MNKMIPIMTIFISALLLLLLWHFGRQINLLSVDLVKLDSIGLID